MSNGEQPGKHRKSSDRRKRISVPEDRTPRLLGLRPGTWVIIVVFLVFLGLAIASQVAGH